MDIPALFEKLPKWHFSTHAFNSEIFWAKLLLLKCFESATKWLDPKNVSGSVYVLYVGAGYVRFYVRKLYKINCLFMYVCSNFGPLLLFNAAAIDYQLQKSIWHMQMSLFCLLLPAWCLIIFGTKLLHICAWPHFWFMKQLISRQFTC